MGLSAHQDETGVSSKIFGVVFADKLKLEAVR
jgi:hypothetical protein